MADTAHVLIPGSEFNAEDHGYDMSTMLRAGYMFGVRVLRFKGRRCLEPHPTGWRCTRAAGHKRRHHATFPAGDSGGDIVLAVWHQGDY